MSIQEWTNMKLNQHELQDTKERQTNHTEDYKDEQHKPPPKHRKWTHVLKNGKQFLFIITHLLCYSSSISGKSVINTY